MDIRTIFMGSSLFSVVVLKALLQSPCKVLAVYTQPDKLAGRGHQLVFSPVKKVALECGVPVIQPESFKVPEVVQRLASFDPELIVVAAFGLILPPEVLALPKFGCLNVHASLLPRHRGPSPVANAILCGDEFTGVTIMLMDEGIDTGGILAQEKVAISAQDTTGSLTLKLAEIGARLLLEVLPQWVEGKVNPKAQDESKATYSRLLTSRDGEIDWHLPALELWRKIRAYDPWPGCYTWYRGKRLKIHQALPRDHGVSGQVGEVIADDKVSRIGVVTGRGILELVVVQLEGRRKMPIAEFVRGERGFVGSILGQR